MLLPFAGAARDERCSFPRVVALALLTFGCMLPVTMLVPALKELVADRYGASAFWTHGFMSINMIGAILAGPIIALLADGRFPRKRIVAIALAADAAFLSLMAVAPNLPLLFLFRFLEGAAHILALSTLMAVASAWSDPARRGRTMGIVGALMMFGTACGTRLGGIAWTLMPNWIFHAAGMIAAMLALLTLFVVAEPIRDAAHGRQRIGLIRLIREQPRLGIAYAYAFIDRLCVGVVITTFGLFLADIHNLDPERRSMMLVRFLIPFAVLVFPAGWLADRIGRIWPLALGSIGFGLVFASYGFAPHEWLGMLMVASGVLSAVMFAPNLTICADLAPSHLRGAAFTGFNIAGSLGFIVGPLLAGGLFTIAARYDAVLSAYQTTFVFTGATQVLCALLTLPALLRLKRLSITQ